MGLIAKKPLTSTPPEPDRMIGPVAEFSGWVGLKPKLMALGLSSLSVPLMLTVRVEPRGPKLPSEGLPCAAELTWSSTISVAPAEMLMVS